ncbi:MAG: plastocyanin/azurin family copper-binding protein [Solirubrobacteraceae bacterium]
MRGWARAALIAGALLGSLLVAVSLSQAHPRKHARICHRRHHRRVCKARRVVRPRPSGTGGTPTTSTSTTATGSAGGSTGPTTTTTTTTQTTTQTGTSTTSTPPPLPSGTEVDERATGLQSPFYAMGANERTLAAGAIHFNVYNFDQDPHTFAVEDAGGQQVGSTVQVSAGHPGTPVSVTVDLPPGTYTLFCTLPQHAADGMETTIVVK